MTQALTRGADIHPMPGPNATAQGVPRCRALGRSLLAVALALLLGASSPPAGWAFDPVRLLQAASALGEGPLGQARALQALVEQVRRVDEGQRIATVNDFFNRRLQYRQDIDLWGQVDYWASPLETLSRGAGDCEDFAIAKYFTLISAGVPHSRLRLVYVRIQMGSAQQPHMVLAYYPRPDAEPWVMDSLVTELRVASARPDLNPVFSFNAEAIWEGVAGPAVRGSATERLSPWAAVMRKARSEGF